MVWLGAILLAMIAALGGAPDLPAAAPIQLAQLPASGIPSPPQAKARGWIGAQIRYIDEKLARELGLTAAGGAMVEAVVPYGPAAKSGLRQRDAIVVMNGTAVVDHAHLSKLTSAQRPGDTAEIIVVRGGQRQSLRLTIGNYFEDQWAAAHRGDSHAMLQLGSIYAEGSIVRQDHVVANEWFRRSADTGNAAAMGALGSQYQTGHGVERDDREAVRWYRKAADGGHAHSMFSLGLFYYRGQGVERDYAEAARWYRRAIEKNHPGAIHNYGILLQGGTGVGKDEAQAIVHFRKAAALGQLESFFMLGDAYALGRGVAKDLHEAARWFREAANRGVGHGHTGLGQLYERGEGGLPKSLAEAIKHYRKGAEAGHDIAIGRLKALNVSAHDPQEMQQLLADLGFDSGAIDGRPGAKTAQAIREFQKSRGLPVNGEASLALVGQLRNALKQKTATASAEPAPPPASASAAKPPDLGNLKDLEKLDSLE
ncbi:MAG: SEL1-like repeat protein [Bradyrhizobiaceae bacterium]|nr:SEL1-like repeat protein [Bradyrhizobiaceae bacterium]